MYDYILKRPKSVSHFIMGGVVGGARKKLNEEKALVRPKPSESHESFLVGGNFKISYSEEH